MSHDTLSSQCNWSIWLNHSKDSTISVGCSVKFSCIWLNPSKHSVISCSIWLNPSKYSVIGVVFWLNHSEHMSITFSRNWLNPSEHSVVFYRKWSKLSEYSITFSHTWSISHLSPHTPNCGLAWCLVQHRLATVIVSEMCLIIGCTLVSLLASGIVSSSSFSSNIECGTESVIQSRVPLCTQWLAIVLVFVVFDMELLLTVLSGMVLTSWVASLIILAVLVFITVTLYWELLSDQLMWVL